MKILKLCFPLSSLSSSSFPFSPTLFPCVCFVVWWFSFCPLFPSLPPLSRSKTTWTWSRTSGARATPGRSMSSRWDGWWDYFCSMLNIIPCMTHRHIKWFVVTSIIKALITSSYFLLQVWHLHNTGTKRLVFVTLSLLHNSWITQNYMLMSLHKILLGQSMSNASFWCLKLN